jgi:RimJ/RimL family protein N-acetyltransferase
VVGTGDGWRPGFAHRNRIVTLVALVAGGPTLPSVSPRPPVPLTPFDTPELLPLMSDPDVDRWAPLGSPTTLADARIWVDRRMSETEQGQTLAWTVRTAVGGQVAGLINLHHVDHEMGIGEVGFFVAPTHRRQGVARTSLAAVSRYAFGAIGLHRLVLIHAVENEASCGVADVCGFALEGVTRGSFVIQGGRVDEHLHARLSSDPALTQRP